MNRTTLSLIAGATALAAVTGFAALSAPDTPGAESTVKAAAQLPVERTSLLCPAPSMSDIAETSYTSFTPVTKGTGSGGKAELRAAAQESADGSGAGGDKGKDDGQSGERKTGKSMPTSKEPGKPVTGDSSGAESPALVGTADGRFAPGWTVQQTTEVAAGTGRGLQGVNCTAPDTSFWFAGASTAADRTDYVHLTNPDDSAAVVDIELYGKDGALQSTVGEGITVQPHSSEPVLLSTLTDEEQTNLTVHVNVRSGRVGAAVQALDDKLGGDWLAASTDPSGSLVLPGIPKDATSVRLVAFTPGDADADLKLRLASPSGLITPAGNETVHVKGGMTTAVDLGDVTRGEAGSLVLTPTDRSVPVVAALRVVRGKGDKQETAFIPATRPVGTRATSADNSAKGSTLSLIAPDRAATVEVTASAGSEGGTPVSETYAIKAGTTQDIEPPVPGGLNGRYALPVEPQAGGPVYGARTLTATEGGVPGFTVQPRPDDRGTVAVPEAGCGHLEGADATFVTPACEPLKAQLRIRPVDPVVRGVDHARCGGQSIAPTARRAAARPPGRRQQFRRRPRQDDLPAEPHHRLRGRRPRGPRGRLAAQGTAVEPRPAAGDVPDRGRSEHTRPGLDAAVT
ncbi:Secreted protein OS=Streptomyces violarus OX=67380 GN=FHS41_006925 PE=4 SV=1 [Streptomyces violarus]